MALRIAMVAGEASSDLLASHLIRALKRHLPDAEFFGIGGPKMQAEGFKVLWPAEKLAVHGYVDALKNYRELSGIRSTLLRRLLADPPAAFIGVDAPDFSLWLEKRLKDRGIPAIHFVSPSIWAWRGGRIEKIRRSADHVLCLFPFEPEIYQRAGIAATFVGHPLADEIPLQPPRAAARQALGLSGADTVVALMPGSRRSEVSQLAPRLLAAAGLLARERPGLRFLLPVALGLRPLIDPLVATFATGLNLQLLDGRSHEVLAACDLTLIASGTATLEAALFKRPMVIVYHLHWLSHFLMKRMAYLPWVGLPNILAREFLVPELIQQAATPEAIAAEARRWLDDAAACDRLSERFTDMHHLLRQGTARRATDALAQVLGR